MSSSSPKINTAAAPLATAAAKPGSSPTSPLSKEHLEGDALISALKQQLEFYFSKQNLATDAYLLSHMNASKFVPIDVIANFRKVKMLTEDRALLVDVMKQCRNLVVDETGTNVRPNIKMERTTLILRDIPASTPIDDIKSIFASTSAPAKPINVRSDIDDTWFVTFESEDACTDTALWLPSQTFQGKSVKCRVKSENLLRGFYYPNAPKETAPITAPIPMQASPTTQWRTTGSAPYYGNGYMPYAAGYPYGYPAGYVQPTGQTPPQTNTRLDGKNERRQKNANNGAPAQPSTRKRGKGADAAAAAGSVQVVAAASGAVTVTGVVSPTAATPAAAPAPGQGKKALKRAKKAAAAQAAAAAATPAATAATKATPDGVTLGLDNFPALPNNPVKKASPVSGYTSTFHEYDREAMAAIVAALCKQSYPRPDTFPTDPDSAIVRKTVLTTCQLMEPFPVIYPASPSPELAAQPTHSGLTMPFLDLGVGPASAVVAGRNPYIDAHPKKKPAPSTTAQPKKKAAAATNATTAASTITPAASTSTTPTPAPAANGKPKSATKASKPKYQKANTSASSSSTSTSTAASTSTSTSTSTSSTPTPAPATPATPAVPVVTAASIVAANANLPVQPNPKQVAAAKKAAEEKAAREREAREKAAAAEAAKTQSKGGKPKYQPKGTKQAAQKDKEKEKDKDKGDKNKENQATQASENKNNETKSNEPPKIKWAAKVGSVDPAVALAKIAKAKAEAEQKAKAEATSSSSSSSSSTSTSSSSSTSSTSTSSTSTSSHSKDHSSKDKDSSHSSKDAASAASPTASDDEANKKLSYAEMARRAKNAAAAAAAAAAKSNGSDAATPTSPTSSRINHSSSPTSPSPSPSPSSQ